MLPPLIVIDPALIDFYGKPVKGAQIFADHVRVHPDEKRKIIEGLEGMFGEVFKILTIKEYNEIKSEKK